jgi:hypothetical protein
MLAVPPIGSKEWCAVITATNADPPIQRQAVGAETIGFSARPRRCELPSIGRRLGGPTNSGLVPGLGLEGPQNRCRRWASPSPMLVRRMGALRRGQCRILSSILSRGCSSHGAMTRLSIAHACITRRRYSKSLVVAHAIVPPPCNPPYLLLARRVAHSLRPIQLNRTSEALRHTRPCCAPEQESPGR